MPMPARGPRIRITARIAPDDFRECAKRAQNRGWTMSDYVAWVIGKELRGQSQGHKRSGPRVKVVETPTPYLVPVDD